MGDQVDGNTMDDYKELLNAWYFLRYCLQINESMAKLEFIQVLSKKKNIDVLS